MTIQFERKPIDFKSTVPYGRNNLIVKLNEYIANEEKRDKMPENIALLGVKGIGKTFVLGKVFCPSCIKEFYMEHRVVVIFVSIPEAPESMKSFYSHIYHSIMDTLDTLKPYNPEEYQTLIQQIKAKKEDIADRSMEFDSAAFQSLLNQTIEIMRQSCLKPLLVFDDFERFADLSNLKNAQYTYLREAANSGRISLIISTAKDLTKVSEEMQGSGFENIFTYQLVKPLSIGAMEDWLFDALGEDIEFSDDVINTVYDVSGGIPALIQKCAESAYAMLGANAQPDEDSLLNEAYGRALPLLKKWWSVIEPVEQQVLTEYADGAHNGEDSNEVSNLIKKGYLSDEDQITFVTPLFKRFVLENKHLIEEPVQEEEPDFENYLINVIQKANEPLVQQLERLREELPLKDDFFPDGHLDFEKYTEALSDYLSDKLTIVDYSSVGNDWNIDKTLWDMLSPVCKSDCSLAYQLKKVVFLQKVPNRDYTPVTVMLGNFLEGILNEVVADVLKDVLYDFELKDLRGIPCKLQDYPSGLHLGAFLFVLRNRQEKDDLVSYAKKKGVALGYNQLCTFADMLKDCIRIRNIADHPGKITTYDEMSRLISNIFLSKNRILNTVSVFSKL